MTLDGNIFRGLFEHEILKPAILISSKGNVNNLLLLKQVVNVELAMPLQLNRIHSLIFV